MKPSANNIDKYLTHFSDYYKNQIKKQLEKKYKNPYYAFTKPKSKIYVDYYKINKSKGDFKLIFSRKGPGKTVQAIREALIRWIKTDEFGIYVRLTKEQIYQFIGSGKLLNMLDLLGFKCLFKDSEITVDSKGIKTKLDKNARWKYILFFSALNEVNNIQSSFFDSEKAGTLIIDEIQNHFFDQTKTIMDKLINIIQSILRNKQNINCYILFNLVNINTNVIIQSYHLQNDILKVKPGQIKRKTFVDNKNKITFNILMHYPKLSGIWRNNNNNSVAVRASRFLPGNYTKVINSDNWAIQNKSLNYIEKLGNYSYGILLNNVKIGVWKKPNSEILQLSSKYNPKVKKDYFFKAIDYDKYAKYGDYSFIRKLKLLLITHKLEFENILIYNSFIELIKTVEFTNIDYWK